MSNAVAALLGLEQQLRKAPSLAQLFYTLVNQADSCVPYTQGLLLVGEVGQTQIVAASDIPTLDYTSAYIFWAERLSQEIARAGKAEQQQVLTVADCSEALALEWQSLGIPDLLLWQPLVVEARDNAFAGALLLFQATPWREAELGIARHLGTSAGHALFALRGQRRLSGIRARLRQRRPLLLLLGLLTLLSFWPLRLSALAPVQVVARQPHVITSPLEGAVEQIHVQPNQRVVPGDPLISLQSAELASEEAIARQSLLVAQSELKTVQQSGFLDAREKGRLAELEARVRLQQAQWQQSQDRLARAEIRADMAGVAVLGDPGEWTGRPVKVGERILLIADPGQVEFEVMLPVKDSIALLPGTEVRVFLDNDPLHAWSAQLKHAGYEPRQTPEQQMAYRLVASLMPHEGAEPRIGLRGTAKVYGERVTLFFYLFRRPITSVRQWLGW